MSVLPRMSAAVSPST